MVNTTSKTFLFDKPIHQFTERLAPFNASSHDKTVGMATIVISFKLNCWWISCFQDSYGNSFRNSCLLCDWKLFTHWSRVARICVNKLTITGPDNGLLPSWHQAIVWTNAGILLIGPLGKKLQWNLNRNIMFVLKKIHLKMSSGKRWSSCLSLNVLRWD